MTRRLKGLGVAMIAVFAIAGTGASAASAADFHFEKTGMHLRGGSTGESMFSYKLASQVPIKCGVDNLVSGTFSGLTSPTASFSGVTEKCNQEWKWTYNGCTKKVTVNTSTVGSFSIDCPAGKQIELSRAGTACRIYVPAQTPTVPTVKLENTVVGKQAIKLNFQVQGITYSIPGCFDGGNGHNGEFSGINLVRGFTDSFGTVLGNAWVE